MALVAALASLRGLRINDIVRTGSTFGLSGIPSSCERCLTDSTVAVSRIDEWYWRSTYRKPHLLHTLLTVSQTSRCLCYDSYAIDEVMGWRYPFSLQRSVDCIGTQSETAPALLQRKCTPCSSKDLQPMTKGSAQTLLEQVPGWALEDVDGKLQLKQSWKTKNFTKGLDLMKEIGNVAESEGGLSENDFILAAKINALNMEGFLRKRATKSAYKTVTG